MSTFDPNVERVRRRNGQFGNQPPQPEAPEPDLRTVLGLDPHDQPDDPLNEDNKTEPRFDKDNLRWDWNERSGKWRMRHTIGEPVESPYLSNVDHLRGPLRMMTDEERETEQARNRRRAERRKRFNTT